MVVCVHMPRFELAVAAAARLGIDQEALARRPLAIAPTPGAVRAGAAPLVRCVGSVSAAAETHGIAAGMALAQALARCPALELVPADPLGVAEAFERVVVALEAIGAAVQAPAPGLAFFEADGLLRLHRGLVEVLSAAQRACRQGRTLTGPLRIGVGPTRFCALAAACSTLARRGPAIVEAGSAARRWLAKQPVELLRFREQTAGLVEPLQRLGVRTLGELKELGADAMSDRFGQPGALAHRLASGEDVPLQPRIPQERLAETMELHEADLGPALERILKVLIERLLARHERDGRTLRAATVSARLVEGGTWRETVVFRKALADAQRIGLALCPRLARLPAPAQALRLEVERFGPARGEQDELPGLWRAEHGRTRGSRLAEAVDQARAAAGPDAALRVVLVEPGSRVPERRTALAPFQG
ncbi:MAG TPA: hypothetical protein VGF95_03945 [Solirubrobacteraceae bacterium]